MTCCRRNYRDCSCNLKILEELQRISLPLIYLRFFLLWRIWKHHCKYLFEHWKICFEYISIQCSVLYEFLQKQFMQQWSILECAHASIHAVNCKLAGDHSPRTWRETIFLFSRDWPWFRWFSSFSADYRSNVTEDTHTKMRWRQKLAVRACAKASKRVLPRAERFQGKFALLNPTGRTPATKSNSLATISGSSSHRRTDGCKILKLGDSDRKKLTDT